MKLWKPKFIENSRVPGWLSKVAPINIWAISLGPFVWCKGDLSEIGVVKYRNGAISYLNNPFEIEAYTNETDDTYLITRKRYAWIKYVIG